MNLRGRGKLVDSKNYIQKRQPVRIEGIKKEYLKTTSQSWAGVTKKDWKNIILGEAEAEGCAACFI